MTRDQIIAKWDGMAPRERDAWVAEVIFGHSIGRERRVNGEIFVIDASVPHGYQRAVPQYTTEISAAWTVFDRDWYIEVARLPYGKVTYGARINGADVGVLAMTQAETAPEAICLAAILAKYQTEVSA